MNEHPARRCWMALEPLHDVVYFAPDVRDVGIVLGLRGFWMTYFAFRAAPLGPVDAAPVTAAFAGFAPGMVAKALPDAWTRVAPAACMAARVEVSAAVLRATGVDPESARAAATILAPVIDSADCSGRPLFAANAGLPLVDDPVGALWQIATTLREHRGDGHVAALVSAGVSGLEAHVLQAAVRRFPAAQIQSVRGWSDDEWNDAATRLRVRGLIADELTLTDSGRSLLDDIEARTDDAAWQGALYVLGDAGVAEVSSILRSSVAAVRAAKWFPAFNPTGLPS